MQSEERQAKKETSFHGTIIFFCFLIIFGLIFVTYITRRPPVDSTLDKVRTKLSFYIRDVFDLNEKPLNALECSGIGICNRGISASPSSAYSWLVAFYATEYAAKKAPDDLKRLKEIVAKFEPLIESPEQYQLLWPLYDAYKATKDPAIGRLFLEFGIQALLLNYDNDLAYLNGIFAMEAASFMKAFVGTCAIVNSNDYSQIIEKSFEGNLDKNATAVKGWFENSIKRINTLSVCPQMLDKLERMEDKTEQTRVSERDPVGGYLMIDNDKASSQGCWNLYTHTIRYEYDKDRKSLDYIKDFLRRTGLGNAKLTDFKQNTLQSIAPCLLSLKALKGEIIEAEGALKRINEQVVQYYFDGSDRALCDGDNSIMSFRGSFGEVFCENNSKALSDQVLYFNAITGWDQELSLIRF